MNTLVKVARYHLVQPVQYLTVTWGVLAFTFAVNIVAFGLSPVSHAALAAAAPGSVPGNRYTGALASLFVWFMVLGLQTVGKSLPFGLALGLSRRSYYAGTAVLAVALACVYGLVVAGLQAIERATDGWGVHMGFFRIPYLLAGPWYLTWLSSFVWLTLLFLYGMWFGIVFRRWGPIGVIAFIAAQITVALVVVLAVAETSGWMSIGRFFTGLSAAELAGLLAVLAVAVTAGGHATIRRTAI